MRQMSVTPELREAYLYHSDSFLPKSDAVPLQAADLLAWKSAKFKHETIDGERDIRRSLRALFEVDPKRYHVSFHGGETLARALNKYHALGLEQLREEVEWRRQKDLQKSLRKFSKGLTNIPESRPEASQGGDGAREEGTR